MKLVYIAHPVQGDVEGNIKRITSILREINTTESDVIPMAPYLGDLLALDDTNTEERQRGIENGHHLIGLGIFQEVWLYGDRISKGMMSEIEIASSMDIPIIGKTSATTLQYRSIMYRWQGQPVSVKFGFVKAVPVEETPLHWMNYYALNGAGPQKIPAVEVRLLKQKFMIANFYGMGERKLVAGGWPNRPHRSIPDKCEFTQVERAFRPIIEPGKMRWMEAKETAWFSLKYPKEMERIEALKELASKGQMGFIRRPHNSKSEATVLHDGIAGLVSQMEDNLRSFGEKHKVHTWEIIQKLTDIVNKTKSNN